MTFDTKFNLVMAGTILVGIVGVVGVVNLSARMDERFKGDNSATGETEARAFLANLGLKATKVSCIGQDTDLNGYLSCTAVLEDRSILPLECAYGYNPLHGCRTLRTNP